MFAATPAIYTAGGNTLHIAVARFAEFLPPDAHSYPSFAAVTAGTLLIAKTWSAGRQRQLYIYSKPALCWSFPRAGGQTTDVRCQTSDVTSCGGEQSGVEQIRQLRSRETCRINCVEVILC